MIRVCPTRTVLCFACLVLPASFSGCSYLSNRGNDLSDLVSVGASAGGGVLIRAVPTRFLTAEVGARKDETFYGWRRRHWHWVESSYGLLFSTFWGPRLGDELYSMWVWTDLFKTSHTKLSLLEPGHPESLLGIPREEWKYHLFLVTTADNARLIDAFDVQVDVSFLIGGFQLSVNLGQFADFFVGLVGLDLAGDDGDDGAAPARAEEPPAKVVEPPVAKPAKVDETPQAKPAG